MERTFSLCSSESDFNKCLMDYNLTAKKLLRVMKGYTKDRGS